MNHDGHMMVEYSGGPFLLIRATIVASAVSMCLLVPNLKYLLPMCCFMYYLPVVSFGIASDSLSTTLWHTRKQWARIIMINDADSRNKTKRKYR